MAKKQSSPPPQPSALTPEQLQLQRYHARELRQLRKNFLALTEAVRGFLACLDAEMKKPSTVERGQRIAKMCNALEMANDHARHFGLDLDLKTGKPRKKP